MDHILGLEAAIHGESDEMNSLKDGLLTKVIPRLLRPLEMNGRKVTPTLIRLDNIKYDASIETTMLFDSCAFRGHNEAGLALWTSKRYWPQELFVEECIRRMGVSQPREDLDDRGKLYLLRCEFLSSILHPHKPMGRECAVKGMRVLVLKYPHGLGG